MRSIRIPFFKIWYSSAFVILFLITLVLTLISPADLIYQSAKSNKISDIITISAVYLITLTCCLFVWFSRIYTNRAVLRDIPKTYLPIDKGEIPRQVRRLIEQMWRRSALIAWDSHPRDISQQVAEEEKQEELCETEQQQQPQHRHHHHYHQQQEDRQHRSLEHYLLHAYELPKRPVIIPVSTARKAWGHIAHPGWSAPVAANGQPQSIRYWSVLVELPHLLEANAVSLAPSHASISSQARLEGGEADILLPDPRLIALLKRAQGMELRNYIAHLSSLALFHQQDIADTFLDRYEAARFSTRAMSHAQFALLLDSFSLLLSSMSLDIDHATTLLQHTNLSSLPRSISNPPRLDFAQIRRRPDDMFHDPTAPAGSTTRHNFASSSPSSSLSSSSSTTRTTTSLSPSGSPTSFVVIMPNL